MMRHQEVTSAVTYLRSSKDRSDVSIDAQRRALAELAHTRGFTIVGEYADAVESGKDDDRPGFQSLITDIRAQGRKWDHILVLDTSRIARRRVIGIIFEEHECKKRGIRIIYKSLPESDPITEMLLKSILQAMDEWHSLTSRVKGLAGMAENVRQGWRAGGRAPRGYRLQHVETGTVRDGEPVTKSKLVPGDDALQVRLYLQCRARGLLRSQALATAGVDWPASSLVEMERNAIIYAGHTVWNRSAERQEGGYVGGKKLRPREDWVVQRDTHTALITEEEAELVMAGIAIRKRGGGAPAKRVYLLAGLLYAPNGERWTGDSGAYRVGKGARVQADSVDRAVVAEVMRALEADDLAGAIAEHFQRLSKEREKSVADPGALKRRMTEIDKKTTKLADLLTETTAQAALLRQIESLEKERDGIEVKLASMESERAAMKVCADITPDTVRRLLRSILDDLNDNPDGLRDAVHQLIERIELSPETFEAVLYYRICPLVKSGELVASPRGFEPRYLP